MILKFNGWQRLWVLASSIYLVAVIVFVVLDFPQPEKIPHEPAFAKRLSPQSQSMLVPEDKGGWQDAKDWGADVDMPNGSRISFKKGVSGKDMTIITEEYWALITATANERRWSLIGAATLWWLMPSIVLYIFGRAIGWVYLGFRGR